MTSVDVPERMNELTDRAGGCVDAATGAEIGPFRRSQFAPLLVTSKARAPDRYVRVLFHLKPHRRAGRGPPAEGKTPQTAAFAFH
jgi:hypothetical protein